MAIDAQALAEVRSLAERGDHIASVLLGLLEQNAEVDLEQADLAALEETYAGASSHQIVATDLTLGAAAGKNHPDTAFLAGKMGAIHGTGLSKTGNYLGGLIGMDDVKGARATLYPKGGVVGIVADGVTESDGGVVAHFDGDSGAAMGCTAMFKARKTNSTAGRDPDFGLDLQDDGGSGYLELVPKKAVVRLGKDLCIIRGSGVPVDGTTGADVAEVNSLYLRDDGVAGIYKNTGTKASPTWSAI